MHKKLSRYQLMNIASMDKDPLMNKASTDKDQLMNKDLTDKHQLMDRASTNKYPSMDKALTDKTCQWIRLTTNYPLTTTGPYEDKMTENKRCRVEQIWQQGQSLLTLAVSLKTAALPD